MNFGERVRKRREQLGMTQDELAKKLGYKSRSSINKIELNERNVKQSQIEELARALQTTPANLMGWDDEPSYYLDPETAAIAQEIHDNPELRALFSASRKASPESLKAVADLIKSMKNET